MPGLVKRTVRTTQPQTAVGIDWSNPITRDLVATVSKCLIYVFKTESTKGLTETRPAKNGVSLSYSSAGISTQLRDKVLATVEYPNKTLLGYSTLSPTAGNNYIVGPSTGNFRNGSCNIRIASDGYAFEYTNSGNSRSSIGPFSVTSGDYVAVLRFTLNNLEGFLDNRKITDTPILMYSGSLTEQPSINISSDGNTSTHLGCVWNRSLSDTEIKSLSDNPWQIFQPDVSYLDAIYQERLTISPDESRWMGSRGRSMEVSEVVQKHISVRTSQPQGPVEIDWGNSATLGLTALNHAFSSLSRKVIGDSVRKTTYSGFQQRLSTPHGITLVEPNNAEGLKLPGVGGDSGTEKAYLSVFWIKDGSITNGEAFLLADNSGGVGFAGGTKTQLYWLNISGERVVGFYNGWSNAHVTISGISDGLHVAIGCQRNNAPLLLFIDGICIEGGTVLANTYSQPGLSTCSFRSPSIDTSGIGTVLLRAYFQGNAYDKARFLSLSKNPWQLFKPQQKTLVYERQVPKVEPPVPKVRLATLLHPLRTTQPQKATSINWSNPITLGINFVWSPKTGTYVRGGTGIGLPTTNTAILTRASKLGISENYNQNGLEFHSDTLQVSNGFTCLYIGGHSSAAWAVALQTSGGIFRRWNGGYVIITPTGNSALSNVVIPDNSIVIASRGITAGNKRFLINGISSRNLSDDRGEVAGPTTKFQLFQGAAGDRTAATYWNSSSSLVVGFERYISDAEAKSLSDNPWQIFQPESKTVWVDA